MRNNKFVFLCFLLVIIPYSIYAFNWTQEEVEKIDNKEELIVVSKTNVDNTIILSIKDQKEQYFKVSYTNDISEQNVKTVLKLKNDFYGWPGLTINIINFNVSAGSVDCNVIPSKFVCDKSNDIVAHLPAGMSFSYTDSLEYNFRMIKDNLFIRMKGYFISKGQFCERLLEALENPAAFIKKRDPEFFLSKLDMLQNDLDKMRRENSMLRWAVIALITDENIDKNHILEVVNIKKANPSIKAGGIKDQLEKKKIDLSAKEINIILTVFFNEFEE